MPDLQLANRLVLGGREVCWGDLLAAASRRGVSQSLTGLDTPAAVVVSRLEDAFEAVAELAGNGIDAVLLGRERLSSGVADVLARNGYSLYDYAAGVATPAACSARAVKGRVSLLTSGSTGTPKLVPHRWTTLYTGRGIRHPTPRRWIVPYQVGTYAWYQVVTLGMFQPDQTLIPIEAADPEALFRCASQTRADSISATPTFWRLALLSMPFDLLRRAAFQSITLGGEMADQAVLDRLRAIYPAAQITHIYASTEAGACAVVKDGKAGFPAKVLERNDPALPALKIQEGRLWIRSPYSTHAATGEEERWIDSGDLVEVRGDRIFFVGRADRALINVGGNKAFPADVEAVLLSHPAVRWCRVRAVRSPLVGFLPEADIVFDPQQPAPSEGELTRFASERLPEYAIPRFWNQLEVIPVQTSLKSAL